MCAISKIRGVHLILLYVIFSILILIFMSVINCHEFAIEICVNT